MGQLPDIEGIDMKIRYKRKDFEFVPVGSRYVFITPGENEIHITRDMTRARQARSWEAVYKSKHSGKFKGMGESCFKTPENAARAALEYWGF